MTSKVINAVREAVTNSADRCACGVDLHGEDATVHKYSEAHVDWLETQLNNAKPVVSDPSAPTITGDLSRDVKEVLNDLKKEVARILADLTIQQVERPRMAARAVRAVFAAHNWPNVQFRGTVRAFLVNDCQAPIYETVREPVNEAWAIKENQKRKA